MKKSLLLSLIGISLLSTAATARELMVDGIPDEDIVQIVDIAGRPGFDTKAALVQTYGEADNALTLVIIESRNGSNYLVVSNDQLDLSVDGAGATGAQLSVNVAGSLRIYKSNQAFPSRDMWDVVLTVSFRDGQYLLSGVTINYTDTRVRGNDMTCDYNLLTGHGILNGRGVRVRSFPTPIQGLFDSEKLTSCKAWL